MIQADPSGTFVLARRSRPRPDLRLEVRRPEGQARRRTTPPVELAAGGRPAALPLPPQRQGGSIRSRKRARRSSCFDYDADDGAADLRGRRSRRCPTGTAEATSVPSSSSRTTGSSSTPATACTTASASSRSARRDDADARGRRVDARESIRGASPSIRPWLVPLLRQPAGDNVAVFAHRSAWNRFRHEVPRGSMCRWGTRLHSVPGWQSSGRLRSVLGIALG